MVDWERARQILFATVTTGLLWTMAACTSESGQAVGGDPAPSPSSPTISSESGKSSGGLEDVVACDLLTPEERDQISRNLKESGRGPIAGASDHCGLESGGGPESHLYMHITIRPEQVVENYKTASGDKIIDGEVSGRPAKQVSNSAGSCVVTFAAERGRVDVTVATQPVEDACDIADQVTEIVASKVPEPAA